MRNFAKLFTLFAAIGLAACTNDVTEDLVATPDFAAGSVKTLTVKLDGATRVELGERTADAKYPVYWSESDVLRINEGATTAINIHEEKSVADFTFSVADAEAYKIVYPYVEGLTAATEGLMPVRFAATQNYTEGTFDAASFPMYGYTEGTELGFGLDYLAGVLMIELKGAGEKLTKVELTVSEGALAGTFDVDCTTGALTAHEDASKTLTYQLPEGGFVLSEEATTLYIAVPAGDYGTMKAKFCTDNADVAMIAGIPCTGEKAIKAGVVREFKGVVFTDNSEDTSGKVFEIYDEATLQRFAELCTAGLFEYGSASVTASFGVSSEFAAAWTPVENFAATFEGNGNTISGMTQPLFGTTTGSIKNLNLKSNLVVSDRRVAGAFACYMNSTEEQTASIVGCSLVEGSSVEIESTLTAKDAVDTYLYIVGGFVGQTLDAVIENSTSYATLSLTLKEATAATATYYNFIGGFVGNADQGTTGTIFTNCENHGAVDFSGMNDDYCIVNLGGVLGRSLQSQITGCKNHGKVTVDDVHACYLYAGGIHGLYSPSGEGNSTIDDCHNLGEIYVGLNASFTRMEIGGIIGVSQLNTMTISNSTNNAPITVKGSTWGADYGRLMVGGIAGQGGANFKDCDNLAGGAILITEGTFAQINDNVSFTIAGCVGVNNSSSMDFTVDGLKNYAPVTMKDIVYTAKNDDTIPTIQVAGVMGYSNIVKEGSYVKNLYNEGKITVRHYGQSSRVGGLVGYMKTSMLGTEEAPLWNAGDLDITIHSYTGMTLGGCVGSYSDSVQSPAEHLLNTGNVTLTAEAGTTGTCRTIYVAGCFGSASGELNHLENRGAITVVGATNEDNTPAIKLNAANVAGCVGQTSNKCDNITNSGNITLANFDVKAGSDFLCHFGGCVGRLNSNAYNFANYANSGNMSIKNFAVEDTHYIGGVVGLAGSKKNHSLTLKNVSNSGTLDVELLEPTGSIAIGGLVGQTNINLAGTSATPLTNSGALNLSWKEVAHSYIGGCVGLSNGKLSYLSNTATADVTVVGHNSKGYRVGGIVGYQYDCNITEDVTDADGKVTTAKNLKVLAVTQCTNAGDIDATATFSATGQAVHVGGIIGYTAGNNTYTTNSGNVTYRGGSSTATQPKTVYMGGIVGQANNSNADTNKNHTNTGKVVFDKTATCMGIWFGGIAGYRNGYATTEVNRGDLEINGSVKGTRDCWIAGCTGRTVTSGRAKSENHGTLTINGTLETSHQCIGGVFAYRSPNDNDGTNHNYGKVVIAKSAVLSGHSMIGGVCGMAVSNTVTAVNDGVVEVLGTINGNLYLGGIAGLAGTKNVTTKANTYNNTQNGMLRLRAQSVTGKAYVGAVGGLTDDIIINESGKNTIGASMAHDVSGNGVTELIWSELYDDLDTPEIYGACGPWTYNPTDNTPVEPEHQLIVDIAEALD
ncbi:MAG: hypothetical protein IKA70_02660 [Alistipes sp.]|nr:hypothetical protein [Alistipes sp.]